MSELVTCKDLTKRFGNHTALDHLNLSLDSGKIIGLLGPNGSGKTTLLKLLNGLLTPSEGEVLIAGNHPGIETCLLYTSPSPRDGLLSRMPSSA